MIQTMLAAIDAATGRLTTTLCSLVTRWRLVLRGAEVGPGLRVRGWVNLHVHRTAEVQVGACCRLNSGFAQNPVGGYRRLGIWVARDGRLVIGRDVGISNSTIMCARSVTIEDEVYIGGGCNIYDTDFHSIAPEARLARPDTTVKAAPILVKRHSFVGAHATILKGVVIGEGAVVAAGSVVTKSVPDGEIWAGNPARFVRCVTPDEAENPSRARLIGGGG